MMNARRASLIASAVPALVVLALAMVALAACSRQGETSGPEAAGTVAPSIARAIGLPVYPGAQPAEGGGLTVKSGASLVVAAYYRTPDALAKVESFYALRLPKGSLKAYLPAENGGTAAFLFWVRTARKQVTLSTDGANTIIALTSTTKHKPK